MYSIYKILNKETERCYIGFSINPEYRRKSHFRLLRRGKHHSYKLQKEYDIYGEDVYDFQLLENNIRKEDVENREIYYIKLNDSYNNGFNCTEGGNINLTVAKYWKNKYGGEHNTAKKVYQYNKKGLFIKEWDSIIEATRSFGKVKSGGIIECCKMRQSSSYGYHWSYEYKGEKWETPRPKYYQERQVIMLDLKTKKELKEFRSAIEAERFFNKSNNHISCVCKGKRQAWMGYSWKYK